MRYSYPVRGSGAGKTRLDQVWVRGLKGVFVYMCVRMCVSKREQGYSCLIQGKCAGEQKYERSDAVRALLFTADENKQIKTNAKQKKKSKPLKMSNTCRTAVNCRALILTSKVDRLQETNKTDEQTKQKTEKSQTC